MILGRERRIELAMHALLESVLVMTTMTMLLLLFRSLFLIVRGRVRLCLFPLPLSGRTGIVCVLGGVGVRGRGCITVRCQTVGWLIVVGDLRGVVGSGTCGGREATTADSYCRMSVSTVFVFPCTDRDTYQLEDARPTTCQTWCLLVG